VADELDVTLLLDRLVQLGKTAYLGKISRPHPLGGNLAHIDQAAALMAGPADLVNGPGPTLGADHHRLDLAGKDRPVVDRQQIEMGGQNLAGQGQAEVFLLGDDFGSVAVDLVVVAHNESA